MLILEKGVLKLSGKNQAAYCLNLFSSSSFFLFCFVGCLTWRLSK